MINVGDVVTIKMSEALKFRQINHSRRSGSRSLGGIDLYPAVE